MTRWTHEQVRRLAPDASSLTAARRLAMPGPWSDTGANETLVWGKCQGFAARARAASSPASTRSR